MKIHIAHRPLHQAERTAAFDDLVVLITGTARAGKSTLARRLRQRLGLHHLEWPGHEAFRAATGTIEAIQAQGGAAVCVPRAEDRLAARRRPAASGRFFAHPAGSAERLMGSGIVLPMLAAEGPTSWCRVVRRGPCST